MNFKSYLISAFIATLCLTSCSGNDEPGGGTAVTPGNYSLSGKVEKGPFVRGSSVTIQPLSRSLTAVGSVFSGEIQDNTGSFNLGQMELESQFVRIASDGYYFNEVNGDLSSGTLHLVALADLSDKRTVNVNIITHLKSARIQKLVASGKSFPDANLQAQKELLTQFGLQNYAGLSVEALSITSGNDGAGALIAISALVLGDRSDAAVTEYISSLTEDLADDGAFSEKSKRSIAQDKSALRYELERISDNIVNRYRELGRTVSVPDLRYYFDWNGDGIAGNEINDNPQVTLSQTQIDFPKEGGSCEITVTSNVTLSLEVPKDPSASEDPSDPECPSVVPAGTAIFESAGKPIGCEVAFDGKKLIIKSGRTERHSLQKQTVHLYDMMGNPVASVNVTLAGDPDISQTLTSYGEAITRAMYGYFANAFSYTYYMERGYTGMYQFYDVKCPLKPADSRNSGAYNAVYQSLNINNRIIRELIAGGNDSYADYLRFLNAILYADIADKWGNSCILDVYNEEINANPVQLTANDILRYAESELEAVSSSFADKKWACYPIQPENIFDMPKDVWRIAKANIFMQLGNYGSAAALLQEVVDGGRYQLSSGNDYESGSGTIWMFDVPESFSASFPGVAGHKVGFYTCSDLILSLAECYLHSGNSPKATPLINQVASKKGVATSGNAAEDIEKIRKALFTPRYFAFQKRNGLGGYEDYQKLWPIPYSQLNYVNGWQQNPGY